MGVSYLIVSLPGRHTWYNIANIIMRHIIGLCGIKVNFIFVDPNWMELFLLSNTQQGYRIAGYR